MKPYSKLSQIYDRGWSEFSTRYAVFLEDLFTRRQISPVDILDLACGTGTLALEMARRGYRVHGIDISPEMIQIARSKAVDVPGVSFEPGDIARFKTGERYDIVTCIFDSINYLTAKADVQRLFGNAAVSLRNGGLFIFDSNTRQLYFNYQEERRKGELEGIPFIQHCRFSPARNIAITTFEFADGDVEVHRQRPYGFDELGPMLACAGFQIIHLFSWFDASPLADDTEKLFCIAQKV